MTNYKKIKEKQDAELEKIKSPLVYQGNEILINGRKECAPVICHWDFEKYKLQLKKFIDKVRKETIEYERKRIKKEFIKWFNSKEIAEDIEDAINRILK